MSRTREALLVFSLIFIITSAIHLYFANSEMQYSDNTPHAHYIELRQEKPLEYFYSELKNIHSYYFATFFIITALYVSLYYYLTSPNRKMPEIIKLGIFVFGMFTGGFLIGITNNLYESGFQEDFFPWLIDVFWSYIGILLFEEFNTILLFMSVAFVCTIFVQFLRLKKVNKAERDNIRKLENTENANNT
ncbi:MAG: hypothetical protein ACO1N9_14035 [Flavobacterium sp.]